MMRARVVIFLAALCTAGSAHAQSFDERVESVRDGAVLFHFAARPGVCGNGASFVRIGRSSYIGEYRNNFDVHECLPGPVVVRITRVNGQTARLESWVGPIRQREGRDLGAVSAPTAARFLLDVARRARGLPAGKAIMPAVLADSSVVWPGLLEIARDIDTRDRSTRQDAAMWLSRFAAAAIAGQPNRLLDQEEKSDETDLKTHAVFVMSQLPRGEAVPMLLDVARSQGDVSVRSAALFWLSQTGDMRAIDLFETLLRR